MFLTPFEKVKDKNVDCLPASNEWSARTRWEFVKEHLSAVRWHLEALEKAQQKGAAELSAERIHLQELCQRGVEAHALLESLALLPADMLDRLAED